jgi:hypothetical protein
MSNQMFCKACHSIGKAKKIIKGSVLMEILLWLLFLLPGIIYTTWRSASAKSVCSQCGSIEIIPADSPMAKKIING